jgi:hypothetical protein
MILALLTLAALLATPGQSSSSGAPPKWEKVFEGGQNDRIYAVAAVGRDDWFLALEGSVAKVTTGNVERHATMPRQAERLFVASPASVYAFGDGELVVHFDGTKWTEEHVGPPPPRPRRRGTGAPDMLYGGYFSESTLIAVGPSLVMAKQPDGSWAYPPTVDRQKLWDAGGSGPRISKPSKCSLAGWHWLGKNRGFFYCHDRRAFVWDTAMLTPKGTMPRKCYDSLHSIAEERGEFYAACNSATLWKTQGEVWQPVAPPKEKGLEDMEFVAAAGGCLFVTGPRSVWRACGQ